MGSLLADNGVLLFEPKTSLLTLGSERWGSSGYVVEEWVGRGVWFSHLLESVEYWGGISLRTPPPQSS